MIVAKELQTSTQSAVARVSQAQHVAAAVLDVCKGDYLHGSELFIKPKVRATVRDFAQLSVILSDAYKQGLIGREFSPSGRERYAYGPVGKTSGDATRRRVIKAPLLGYAITITKHMAEDVLEIMSEHPGAKFTKTLDGYQVSISFDDKGKALDFLIASDMLIEGVKLVEVR